MASVLNKHKHGIPPGAVYIGRGSKWGNPFVIGKDGTRDEVIAKYNNYLKDNKYLLGCLSELKDKDLVCFCSPCACHGDILISLANNNEARDLGI